VKDLICYSRTGYHMLVLERQELLQVLYNGIKGKSKCLSHVKVISYEEDETGIHTHRGKEGCCEVKDCNFM
jgi:hypothetical protein